MDLERLQRLSGLSEKMTPVKVDTNTNASIEAARKKAKENNKTPTNKTIDDVRTAVKNSDIEQDVVATLDDIDDSGIQVKAGKTDINGNKVIAKGERLTYTVSVDPKTGAPKVDDELKKELINVETFGECAKPGQEGFLVASVDNIYLCYEGNNQYVMIDDRSKAAVFETQEQAEQLADLFTNSTVRRIFVETSCENEENDVCPDCGDEPCTCGDGCGCDDKCDCKSDDEDEEQWIREAINFKDTVIENNGNILADIQNRLQNGEEVKVALNYQGDVFTGFVQGVSNQFLDVRPTQKAISRYNIKDKTVKLPIDPSTMQWSQQMPGLIQGKAKEVQALNQTAQSQQQQPQGRASFFPGVKQVSPKTQGSVNDPSTWQIDMSSKQYKAKPLTEYINMLKEQKKNDRAPVINNLVAKHAGSFNKAATHKDRKKDAKRGVVKHKKNKLED